MPRRQCASNNRKEKPRIIYRKTYKHDGKVYKVTIDSKETLYVELDGENIYTGTYDTKKIRTFHMVPNPTAKKRKALKNGNRASRVSRVMAKLGVARKNVCRLPVVLYVNAAGEAANPAAAQAPRAGNGPRAANVPLAANGGRNNVIVIDDDDFNDSGNEDGFSDEFEDI